MARSRTSRRVFAVLAAALVIGAAVPGVASAATVTVAAAGDIARPNSPGTPQRQTADLITDVIDPARVLMLGDAQYQHGEYSQFQKSYDPTWGAFRSITAPVPGNHEYETSQASGYFTYFSSVLSGYGSNAGNWKKGYYSFDLGDWHIVGLNTNCKVTGVSCSTEKSWLKSDLNADGHLCEIAFTHHPNKSFASILSQRGVDLYLNGHRHVYERWDDPWGFPIRQLIVGTGGIGLGSVRSGADAGVRQYGVMELTLNATSYSWRFLDVNGNVRDSGSDTCRS